MIDQSLLKIGRYLEVFLILIILVEYYEKNAFFRLMPVVVEV